MNQELLRKYISEYEKEFHRIHRLEIYKWRAVQQFQDAWNLDADNFTEMLQLSLSKTRNLMAAAQYWPERMIIANAEKNPDEVRSLFAGLFDEERDVFERIIEFRKSIKELNSLAFPGKKDYQDERAVLVYLNLRYPESYYFYKFEMFKEFCKRVEYEYIPRRGSESNVAEYFYLCNIIRDEIRLNNRLLKLHKGRIGEDEYFDADYNILTQDFIYAVTGHLIVKETGRHAPKTQLKLKKPSITILQKEFHFVGKYVDHIAQQRRNKHIGDIGELIVLAHERDHCPPEFASNIERVSRTKGDGVGFDILSYDDTGCEKYIEVKATTGPASRSFHVSGTELARSKAEGDKYFLYRLFNLNEENRTADFFIVQGDLSKYCINPTEFEVIVKI